MTERVKQRGGQIERGTDREEQRKRGDKEREGQTRGRGE